MLNIAQRYARSPGRMLLLNHMHRISGIMIDEDISALDKAAFGGRLALVRKRAKLKQHEMAERLGLSKAAISASERGLYVLGLEYLCKLSKEFGVDLHWLITGGGVPRSGNFAEFAGDVVEEMGRRSVPLLSIAEAMKVPECSLAGVLQDRDGPVTVNKTHYPCSDRSFEVKLINDANAPVYNDGDFVVIDPQGKLLPGEMVLLSVNEMPIFGIYKPLSILGPTEAGFEIVFHNPVWTPVRVSPGSNYQLVGVATEHIRPGSRR